MESYHLVFVRQTYGDGQANKGACYFTLKGSNERICLPKSQIEVDGVSCDSDFDDLVPGEEVEVYIPDWLAEKKDLL